MLTKLLLGLKALVNPRSSEFWAGTTAVVGYIATQTGWVSHDTWNQWSPGILTYVGARFVSKTAKA